MMPGVFWSGIYHMASDETIARNVPPTRQKKPKIDWPEAVKAVSFKNSKPGEGRYGMY